MLERPLFVRTWLLLFALHAALAAIIAAVSRLDLPGWLRDPLGIFSVFTLYGPIALASRLGVATVDIEAFIKGQADAAMTRRLGLTTVSAATELGTASGTQGAIGIVLGLLISK